MSDLDYKKAIPNRLLQEDGTITDLQGNPIGKASDAFSLAPALPNKVLNADGSYSKLSDIIGGGGGGTSDYETLFHLDFRHLPGQLIQKDSETPQSIETDVVIEKGKSLELKDETGETSSLLATKDGKLEATIVTPEGTETKQVAYTSDIQKAIGDTLEGVY